MQSADQPIRETNLTSATSGADRGAGRERTGTIRGKSECKMAFLRARNRPNPLEIGSYLAGTEISLIARFRSLLDRKQFPVRMRRELGRKLLMLLCILAFSSATKRESVKNSLFISL
jgi:hypothetical protein